MSYICLALLIVIILVIMGKVAYNKGHIENNKKLSSVGNKIGELLEGFESQPAKYVVGHGCRLPEIKQKDYIDYLPPGATQYPPDTFHKQQTPPPWKFKS